MKKFLFFLMVILFVGCCNNDCIGQIPPIPAYVDDACKADMPNVLPLIAVSDNCELSSVVQIPLAGVEITPPLIGKVIATDASGNMTTVEFQVVKMDTISPIITWVGPVALVEDFEEASKHYTHFIAFLNYDIQNTGHKIQDIPEFDLWEGDTWYNTIVIQ